MDETNFNTLAGSDHWNMITENDMGSPLKSVPDDIIEIPQTRNVAMPTPFSFNPRKLLRSFSNPSTTIPIPEATEVKPAVDEETLAHQKTIDDGAVAGVRRGRPLLSRQDSCPANLQSGVCDSLAGDSHTSLSASSSASDLLSLDRSYPVITIQDMDQDSSYPSKAHNQLSQGSSSCDHEVAASFSATSIASGSTGYEDTTSNPSSRSSSRAASPENPSQNAPLLSNLPASTPGAFPYIYKSRILSAFLGRNPANHTGFEPITEENQDMENMNPVGSVLSSQVVYPLHASVSECTTNKSEQASQPLAQSKINIKNRDINSWAPSSM